MNTKIVSVLIGLSALSLAGCATQNVNTVERAQSQATPNYISDKRVVTDYSLAKTVRVQSINEGLAGSDHKMIQITFENITSRKVNARYRVEWFDQGGMLLSSPTDLWLPLFLEGRETATVQAVSTHSKAVDFVLKIQETKLK